MNFRKPSKIQERALPLLAMNPPMNMIGQSQSGTGKTAAFVLNMLSRIDLKTPDVANSPQALCLAPSRELARQILGVVQIMGAFLTGLTCSLAVPADIEHRAQKIEGNIIVGTPGTVLDKIKRRQLNTQHINVLVLDEADNMLDQQGLGDQCIRVKQYVFQPYRPCSSLIGHTGYSPKTPRLSSSLLLFPTKLSTMRTDSPPKPTKLPSDMKN
jgi:ATP-dependent RNA helicase DDX19/DBP5